MAYDNTDEGALFKNDKKQTDKHPDYTGKLNVGGKDHWLSAWLNKSKSGETYMKLSITPKDEQREAAPSASHAPITEDDIPW